MAERDKSDVGRAVRPGFTLIELLVVIAVIAILLGIAVTLGPQVIGGAKATRTEQTIGVLDSVLTSYMSEKGRKPAESVPDPRDTGTSTPRYLPVADARNMTPAAPLDPEEVDPRAVINSVGLFLLQVQDVPAAYASIESLDAQILSRFDPDTSDMPGSPMWNQQPELTTVFDAWGRPIRFVHPSFDGLQFGDLDLQRRPESSAELTDTVFQRAITARASWSFTSIRRNNEVTTVDGVELPPDSDGGTCRGDQPYFYSSGGDEDPSTFSDNVYTTEPQRPVVRN